MSNELSLVQRAKKLPSSIRGWFKKKFNFNQQGKTILKIGNDTMISKGEPLTIMKTRSSFWTRLKNLVMLPWRYLRHGRIEL